jgi:short-subunit dehydrogenase
MDNTNIALITGASSGIGRAFADRLATDGYALILVARRRERLEAVAGELRAGGARVEVLAADLADPAGLQTVEKRLAAGDIAMLVNNAGFAAYGPFVEMDPDVAEQQIALHCTALVRLTRAALPAMVTRGAGAVVNVSSNLAFSGSIRLERPKRATYAGTKAFINAFTQILAQELEGTGVKVQALCPALVRSEFHDRVGGRPPGIPATEPSDIVRASIAGLALGEVLCVPTLAGPAALARISAAEQAFFKEAFVPRVAARYGEAKS